MDLSALHMSEIYGLVFAHVVVVGESAHGCILWSCYGVAVAKSDWCLQYEWNWMKIVLKLMICAILNK